jgi:hypothetical protein
MMNMILLFYEAICKVLVLWCTLFFCVILEAIQNLSETSMFERHLT